MAMIIEWKEQPIPRSGTHPTLDRTKERMGMRLQPRWGQRREQMARHVTSFLATFGPVMLLLGVGVVFRLGLVLEMLR